MGRATWILWALFGVSVGAAAWLCARDIRREPGPPEVPGDRARPADRSSVRMPRVPKAESIQARDSLGRKTLSPARGTGAKEGLEPDAAPGRRPTPTPEAFLAYLMDLARRGDLEALCRHMQPGAIRLARGFLLQIFMQKAEGGGEGIDRLLRGMEFDFEETPDGLVRLRVQDPEGESPPEDIYLVPRGASWEIAAESDLPGPAARRRRAVDRLRLLAVCQHTFFAEDPDGGGPDYAQTTRDLAEELDRSPLYAGVLDPEFVAAVDAELPIDGFRFGRVETEGGDFAYYAAPIEYGGGTRETLLIDVKGRVWARDLGGEPPPSAWPGPDVRQHGWSRR